MKTHISKCLHCGKGEVIYLWLYAIGKLLTKICVCVFSNHVFSHHMTFILLHLNLSGVSFLLVEDYKVAMALSCHEYYKMVRKITKNKVKKIGYPKKKPIKGKIC